jgi:hypothetical protein
MKKNYNFIPTRDDAKDLWLKNFATKLPQFVSKYSISAAEQADITQGSALFTYWLNYKNQNDEYNRKLAQYKNELRDGIETGITPSIVPAFPSPGVAPTATAPGIFVRAGSVAVRIKKHVAYTIADGFDLGIEATSTTGVNLNTVKPQIRVHLIEDGNPEILWVKKSMDQIEIHVDRGEGYELLVFDTYPNYTDTNTLEPGTATVWKYKAIYIKKDVRVGFWSDEVTITVTGKA